MTDNNEDNKKIEILKKISLFSAIANDYKAMTQVADLFTTLKLEAKQNVTVEGEEGDSLYIIKSGIVEVVKKTRKNDPYTVVELSADMNIFFGEVALFDSDKRSATVVCKTDCEFYELKRDTFLKFGETNPKAALYITRELSKILCSRLRKVNSDVITLFDALVSEVEESGGISD